MCVSDGNWYREGAYMQWILSRRNHQCGVGTCHEGSCYPNIETDKRAGVALITVKDLRELEELRFAYV